MGQREYGGVRVRLPPLEAVSLAQPAHFFRAGVFKWVALLVEEEEGEEIWGSRDVAHTEKGDGFVEAIIDHPLRNRDQL